MNEIRQNTVENNPSKFSQCKWTTKQDYQVLIQIYKWEKEENKLDKIIDEQGDITRDANEIQGKKGGLFQNLYPIKQRQRSKLKQ